jgi:uroporphyrin-III C-methyltransferase
MQTADAGKVYLTGAGPGDPDLLTVRAHRLLATADLVLHDGLVDAAILRLAGPQTRVVSVAKRAGDKSITQAEIDALMVQEARAGRSVVRLKVGDPLLFGRAAEEIAALRQAGIPFEIVPGITAALAAAAVLQCPLTARDASSGVLLLAGHRAGRTEGEHRYFRLPENLASATLALYMPGPDYAGLAQDLAASGLPPQTPCAVISQCSLPGQQMVRLTLAELGSHAALPAPALVMVGKVFEEAEDSAATP